MGEFDLINLGSIGEPAAGIINHFMDKISGAVEWVARPSEMKKAVQNANKSIIEEIAGRTDINPIERGAIINHYKRCIKEYANQTDVVEIALEHLNREARPEEVTDDWITFFFDKVRNENENYMKIIWGKILAGEFNEPNMYTKQFLHTMSIMDSTMAKRFQKIRSSCFLLPPEQYLFIYRTNSSDIDNSKEYEKFGIFYKDIRELDSVGLIQYRYPNFYTLKHNHIELFYGNKKIELNTDKRKIATGNISLTEIGKQLCKISAMEYNYEILDICVHTWNYLGYHPQITEWGAKRG